MKEGKKDNRLCDWDIRVEFIKRNKKFFKDNVFVNEFGINSTNVVDLASFDFSNNTFYGFEIKSERDKLERLYNQLTSYTTFFNIVYVVEHEKHVKKTIEMIESYKHLHKVGIIKVSNSLEFEEIRKAYLMKPFYDLFIKNLDIDDLRLICEQKGIEPKGNRNQLASNVKLLTTLDEVYAGIHNKLMKLHVRYCPKCGSNLFYKTRGKDEPTICHCYECGNAWQTDLIADLW